MTQEEFKKNSLLLLRSMVSRDYSEDTIVQVARMLRCMPSREEMARSVVRFRQIIESSATEREAYSKLSRMVCEIMGYPIFADTQSQTEN